MRPIDADALIQNHFSDEHRIALSYADKLWMRRIINNEPTIDVVTVIRCKDCKYYERLTLDCDDYYCVAPHAVSLFSPNKKDFCSYGERKEATP